MEEFAMACAGAFLGNCAALFLKSRLDLVRRARMVAKLERNLRAISQREAERRALGRDLNEVSTIPEDVR